MDPDTTLELDVPFWPPMHPAQLRCASLPSFRCARFLCLALPSATVPRRPELTHLFLPRS